MSTDLAPFDKLFLDDRKLSSLEQTGYLYINFLILMFHQSFIGTSSSQCTSGGSRVPTTQELRTLS